MRGCADGSNGFATSEDVPGVVKTAVVMGRWSLHWHIVNMVGPMELTIRLPVLGHAF